MSHLIVITAEMHKIAQLSVNVKHRLPGNVIKYIPVEFEIFQDGEYYKAVPLHSCDMKRLTNVPDELSFQIRKRKVYNLSQSEEEVITEIVSKLISMNFIEKPKERLVEIKSVKFS